jgi:hypothetical protein
MDPAPARFVEMTTEIWRQSRPSSLDGVFLDPASTVALKPAIGRLAGVTSSVRPSTARRSEGLPPPKAASSPW